METSQSFSQIEGRPAKKQKKEVSDNQLEANCALFLEKKWKLIEKVELKEKFELSLLIRSNPSDSALTNFLLFFPDEIWNILISAVNRNLAFGSSSENKKDTRKKDVTKQEFVRFYGIQI